MEAGRRPFFHERWLPFRGQWPVPWVIKRYFQSSLSGVSPRRFWNAVVALGEMEAGRVAVRSMPIVLRVEACNACNLRCPLCAAR